MKPQLCKNFEPTRQRGKQEEETRERKLKGKAQKKI
jgi:hypothetical protein